MQAPASPRKKCAMKMKETNKQINTKNDARIKMLFMEARVHNLKKRECRTSNNSVKHTA